MEVKGSWVQPEVIKHKHKLLKTKHLSVCSALPLALARTSIHRRWINFFLTSDNSFLTHPHFYSNQSAIFTILPPLSPYFLRDTLYKL